MIEELEAFWTTLCILAWGFFPEGWLLSGAPAPGSSLGKQALLQVDPCLTARAEEQ